MRKPPKFPWDEIIVIISTMINRFTWIYFYGIMISFSDFMEYFQEQKFCWGILKLCIQWKAFKFGAKEWYFPPNLDLFPTQFESQDNSQERGFSWGWFEFWCDLGWRIDIDIGIDELSLKEQNKKVVSKRVFRQWERVFLNGRHTRSA